MTLNYFTYSLTKNIDPNNIEDEESFSYRSSLFFDVNNVSFYHNGNNDILSENIAANRKKPNASLLPPGIKYINNNHLVYERPPTHKLINCYSVSLDGIESDSRIYSYYLPIPWQLYIASFDDEFRTYSVRMYFMNTPLYSEDQVLYMPYIPNFYTDGSLCRPFFNSLDDIEKYPKTYEGIVQSSYDWIWSSNFNLDLTESISSIYNQRTPIEVSRNIMSLDYSNYRVSFKALHETYSLIEKFSLSEVSSYIWPNVSLQKTFNMDDDNKDMEELFQKYCDQHDIYYDEDDEDFSSYDDFYEYTINSDHFISNMPSSKKVPKTFNDIISFVKSEESIVFKNKIDVLSTELLKLIN